MTLSIVLLALGLIILLMLEAFFSGSEMAFISASRPKLFRKAKEKNAEAIRAKNMLNRPETLFSTTIVGTTLAITTATTVTTLFTIEHFGYNLVWVNLIFLTPLILIFGEFVPKTIGRIQADSLILVLARPLQVFSRIFTPLTAALSLYAQLLKKITSENPERGFFLSREELKAALPASQGSDVTSAERLLIERILESGQITVREILCPLIRVIAIEETQTIRDAIALLTESRHSRLPVYQERVDNIVGLIHGFDCLKANDLSQPVKTIMQTPLYVPESRPLQELLDELKLRPMAIAVNEYGGAEGILTMEDVMEEIVGEIEDEYDEPPKLYRKIGEHSYVVNAKMEISQIQEQLHLDLPESDDYQTLAGFLLQRMQKIPKKWDSTIIDGVEYVVQAASDRSIEEVYVTIKKPKPQVTNQN